MREAAPHDGRPEPSLLYSAGSWEHKGSATDFTEDEWFVTLKEGAGMDELVTSTRQIMDRYDPDKRVGTDRRRVGRVVRCRAGHESDFLYQQNTLRDALVAGVTLKSSTSTATACGWRTSPRR